MRIGKTIYEIETLSTDDLTKLIEEAKHIRSRKIKAKDFQCALHGICYDMRNYELVFTDKNTGEILDPTNLVVYDCANNYVITNEG